MIKELGPEALTEPAAYKNPDAVLQLLARLRRDQPVSRVCADGVRPFWAVTRYEDIRYIESHPEQFLAGPRAILLQQELEQSNLERFGNIHGVKTLVHMDGEEHRAHRLIARDWFMPKNIEGLKTQIDELAHSFVDRMAALGDSCDFAADIACWYPLRVVMQLIGVPEADEPRILRLTQQLFAPEDSEFAGDSDANACFIATVQEMAAYFSDLAERRRREPCGDIASVLANAEIDGQPLDPFALTSYFVLLATAGHDTTSASIAGGLQALIENPRQLTVLRAAPELLPLAADEMIRWVSPVKHFVRTATEDLQLGGQHIAAGDSLAMFFASANRDETVFEQPDQFRVDRQPNRHLAFGFGQHNCLGMHLARMEIQAFFRALLPRLEHVELAAEPSYIESQFVSGLKSLPLRYRLSGSPASRIACGGTP